MTLDVLDQGMTEETTQCEYHYSATGTRCQNDADRWVLLEIDSEHTAQEAQCGRHFMGDTDGN